jgi:hypothetical protein
MFTNNSNHNQQMQQASETANACNASNAPTESQVSRDENNYNEIDRLLEKEKQRNKSDNWNKIDKTVKIQKLHQFAERYGKEHGYPAKDIKLLKAFFIECLEKNKLQKTKDVSYDKDKQEIDAVPALHFNQTSHNFTLRIIDAKRVSTLKSLTPKRVSAKETPE